MKKWYAVQFDRDDTDWGYGSYSFDEAEEMLYGHIEGRIAVIEEGDDPVCIDELKYYELFPQDRYRVKPESIDIWYGSAGSDEIDELQTHGFPFSEVERLSRDWGVSVDELLHQLEPVEPWYEVVVTTRGDSFQEYDGPDADEAIRIANREHARQMLERHPGEVDLRRYPCKPDDDAAWIGDYSLVDFKEA